MIGLKIASHSPAVSSFQSENPKDVRARNSSVGYRYGLFAVWYSLFAKPLAPSASASSACWRIRPCVAVTGLMYNTHSVIIVANTFAAREDSVFVVIGSERELAQKGLVRREGGTLLMFGRGKTLVPGRTLDPSHFTILSKARDRQIMLPRADKDYRIVSRQALEFTDLTKPRDAVVRGTLTITDSERFWAPSKFLILVEK